MNAVKVFNALALTNRAVVHKRDGSYAIGIRHRLNSRSVTLITKAGPVAIELKEITFVSNFETEEILFK